MIFGLDLCIFCILTDDCPLGDDPFVTCSPSDCKTGSGRHGDCCHYCQQLKTTTQTTTTTTEIPTSSHSTSTTTFTENNSVFTNESRETTHVGNYRQTSTSLPVNSNTTSPSDPTYTSPGNESPTHSVPGSTPVAENTTHPVPGSTTVADNKTHFVSGTTTVQDTATPYSTMSTFQTMSDIPIITPRLEASVGVYLSLVALLWCSFVSFVMYISFDLNCVMPYYDAILMWQWSRYPVQL